MILHFEIESNKFCYRKGSFRISYQMFYKNKFPTKCFSNDMDRICKYAIRTADGTIDLSKLNCFSCLFLTK